MVTARLEPQVSTAVASDGAVWMWGPSESGYTDYSHRTVAQGDVLARLRPRSLAQEKFGGSPVVMVACGSDHTMVLTAKGRLWTIRVQDPLGHGDGTNMVPTRVDTLRIGEAKIMMGAPGETTAEGDVYTWGSESKGALGLNCEKDRLVPTNIDSALLGGCGVVIVAAGCQFSVAVTVEGALLSWGWGADGALGLGDQHNRPTSTRVGQEEVFDGLRVLMAPRTLWP
jgi:alpha-tubulin suppressor-like RCC1 family protein